MNTCIISSITTNRASDRYSKHSKRECVCVYVYVSIMSPTRTHGTDKIEG